MPEPAARDSPQAALAREQWQAVVTESGAGTKLNKRGLETRARLLDVAIRCLADSGGEPVSANRIAKDAGVTWRMSHVAARQEVRTLLESIGPMGANLGTNPGAGPKTDPAAKALAPALQP